MKINESQLVALGSGGVGKTSLILQYLQESFSSDHCPTIEDCHRHILQLPNGLFHAFKIMDTSGSLDFPAMRELNISSGIGFILVFAVDSKQSFYEIKNLWNLITTIKGSDDIPVVVVGNKLDLSIDREVSWKSANDFVESINGLYVETSAKYNLYVDDVFEKLITLVASSDYNDQNVNKERDQSKNLFLSLSDISSYLFRKKCSLDNSTSSATHSQNHRQDYMTKKRFNSSSTSSSSGTNRSSLGESSNFTDVINNRSHYYSFGQNDSKIGASKRFRNWKKSNSSLDFNSKCALL